MIIACYLSCITLNINNHLPFCPLHRFLSMNGPERQPSRVVSLDSLLMVDPVDSTARQQPDRVEMHDNLTATQTISGQNSNEGHGTTQPNRQADELREGEGSQSGSSSSETPPSTKKVGHSLLRDWAPEIAALVVAFCCLAAIYIVLAKFNDQQQAIQTVPCQKSSPNGTASVPIAQTSLKGVETTSARTHLLTKDLKASLIAGLAGMQQPNSISPFCPSGNCAFQASDGLSYSTIALSSECIDVSSLITQSEVDINTWVYKHNMNVSPAKITNYTLPNGLTLGYMLIPGAHQASGYSRWTTMLAQAQLDFRETWLENITMTNRQRHIVFDSPWVDAILLLMPTINTCENPSDYDAYLDETETFAMPPTKADSCPGLDLPGVDTLPGYFSVTGAACFFYPSLQQYESMVVNGALQEKALQDPSPIASVHSDAGTEEKSCTFCTILDPCVVDGVVYTNTSANLSSVPGGTTIIDNATVPLRCLYGFGFPWYRALMVSKELWNMIGSSDDANLCIQAGNYTSMVCSGTWWLNSIFNGGNASIASISEFMTRGFDSLSTQLRLIGTDWDGNPTNAPGTAYDTAVCVLFRWEWLLYPLALVIGASVLLLLLLASNSGMAGSRKEVIWKSSVLPFLFYGLEDQFRDQTSELAQQKELKGAAKALRTKFSPGDNGWRFYN